MKTTSETDAYFPSYPMSSVIYLSCALTLIVAAISLPFLQVDISVTSPGLIRPASITSTIQSVHTGQIKESYLSENKTIHKGDLLFVIESQSLAEQWKHYTEKITLKENLIHDARMIIASSFQYRDLSKNWNTSTTLPAFRTSVYRQSYNHFRQGILEARTRYNKSKNDFDRQNKLFKDQVIAAIEFEMFQFELLKSEDALKQIIESSCNQWENELRTLREEKSELKSQLAIAEKEQAELYVRAPISGTLQNLAGVYPGSLVYTNQELGQISPDTSLLVIALVPPSEIGLIQKGMKVNLQIDAFNYNQWGMATGEAIDLSQDVKIIDNKPLFEVRCSMDQEYLQLRSGYKGFLKKGMTLRARFLVTKRSLWELLYDKVDDWANPNL